MGMIGTTPSNPGKHITSDLFIYDPLRSKKLRELCPTDIVFQTEYWGKVKNRLGWKPYAFDIGASPPGQDVLVVGKSFCVNKSAAYVPQGPKLAPEEGNHGIFLEALSDIIG
jgi:hypothetical protein